MTDRELMQQMLKTLENVGLFLHLNEQMEAVDAQIAALRARLAEPEPFAYALISKNGEWLNAEELVEQGAAAEREARAKMVEASPYYDWHPFACEVAAAIRARGGK